MRNVIVLLLCFFIGSIQAQESKSFWRSTNEALISVNLSDRSIIPSEYQTLRLDVPDLKTALVNAPEEFSTAARQNPFLLDIPMDDGRLVTFAVSYSPVMMSGLAAKYPSIKSYAGYSVSEKGLKLRFSLSDNGFRGVINTLTEGKVTYIDPYAKNETEHYISYDVKNHVSTTPAEHLACGVDDYQAAHPEKFEEAEAAYQENLAEAQTQASTRGAGDIVELKTYRFALSCTGQWGATQGTVENALAQMVVATNRLNQIFEIELGFRLLLIDNNDELIFMDLGTDPYISPLSGPIINASTPIINNIVGSSSYDVGHVFHGPCDTGGLAQPGSVCGPGKAAAITCHYSNDFDYMVSTVAAHEIGHSFGAPHTWNRCQLDNLDNISSGTAYEPGSGYTIMSYYGVCNPTQNVEENGPQDYYHANSLERIYTFTNVGSGNDCANITATNNHFPDLNLPYNNGFYIPMQTPFELLAEATDEDNDNLTYSWEQYNLSPLNTFLGSPEGNEPSFRSFPPKPSPLRVFPKMQDVVNNSSTPGEILPAYTRNLTFRCSVRDNNPEISGVVWAEMSFEATDQAGPFLVTHPNSNTTWEVGDYTEVTWDVANTDANPVNCQMVNIKLSNDGGYTYPVTLAANVPNDGSHFVVVPDQVSTNARVRIESVGNIFFDISNTNFEIVPATTPGYTFDIAPYSQQVCSPNNPTVDVSMMSLINFNDPVTFTVSGLPTGAVANFTNNPATPNSGTEMTIDMSGVGSLLGEFEIIVEGIAPDVDTHYRSIFLDLVSNDFSALALTGPQEGEQGVTELPTFTWVPTANALFYEIQIASNPSFVEASLLEEATNVTNTTYTPSVLLAKSTPYFWRVRPINACGDGAYTATSAFHTEVLNCSNYVSANVPIGITGQGTPTIESFIDIPQSGSISDLNVTKIKGQHDMVRHIAVSLESPEGTEVQLFSGVCPGSSAPQFDLGIDDQAPGPISCPPTGGSSALPQTTNALATFNGEDSEGIWLLRVSVIDGAGSGGSLQDWSMQVCTNASPSAPFLVNNNVLLVPPGAFNYVLNDQLLCEDDDNTANQLTYTLIEKPENGTLIYNGNPLDIGGTFRQSTINAGNLTYEHNGGTELTDQFKFTVADGNGGWIPPTVFQVEIDEDAIVSTIDPLAGNELLVFPNPTKDILNVKLANPINAIIQANLYNVQGQLVATQHKMNGMDVIRFETAPLSAGLYFVEVELEGQSLTQKVAVYK